MLIVVMCVCVCVCVCVYWYVSVVEGLEDLVRQNSPSQDEQKPSLDLFLRCLLPLNSAPGFQIKKCLQMKAYLH